MVPFCLQGSSHSQTYIKHVVFLDHDPAWQQVQRRAFMDWLYAGGTVHIFHGTDSGFPKFSSDLAELNSPLERLPIGSGLVVRHDFPRAKITREMANRWTKTVANANANRNRPNQPYDAYNVLDRDTEIFGQLRRMTQPKHNWIIIFLMGSVYLLLIFPGGFILGHLRVDYRIIYGSFLALVIVFCLGFNFVGSRGYGETTTVNHVAIARPLDKGRFDVMQWSNVFVTHGDLYKIEHRGSGTLYSTCQDRERVRGTIDNGVKGRFQVDIPPYSNRPFGSRMQVKLNQPIKLKVESWQTDENALLEKLVVIVDESFPKNFRELEVLYGNWIYPASITNGRLEISYDSKRSVNESASYQPRQQNLYYGMGPPLAADAIFKQLYPSLLVNDLQRRQTGNLDNFRLSQDRARIYVYADMPKEFQIDTTELGNQAGRVLFVLDVLKPEQQ